MSMNDYTIKMNIKLDKDDVKEVGKEVAKATGTGLKDGIKDAWNGIAPMLKNRLTNLFSDLGRSIVNLFKDSISEMKEMLEFSKLSNAETRELAFGYGFSSSQAYGWSKALEQLGMSSEEDLMYANAQELQQFRAAFEKYSGYYDELAESGYFEKLQEYQVAMEDFKMEMQQEVIGFFIDNKDEIMNAMKGIMTITTWIVKGFSWLMGDSSANIATTSDIVSQYNNTSNSSSNANLSVVNNFNNVDSSVSSDLSREINQEYRQVIRALGGDA